MKRKLYIINIIFASTLLTMISCKKWVDIDPPINNIAKASLFSTDLSAIQTVNSIYATIGNNSSIFLNISIREGMSADELKVLDNSTYLDVYKNKITSSSNIAYWNGIYNLIYSINSNIEGLESSTNLTPIVKQQLLGESRFMRAFSYFYLVNFYGAVPLILDTDFRKNSSMSRTNIDEVYRQIVIDLTYAKTALSNNFLDANLSTVSTERVRPTKWAASALLARTYLYMGSLGDNSKWSLAEKEASEVIGSSLFDLPSVTLTNVFLKNSREAIWQIQPVITGYNTFEGRTFVLTNSGPGLDKQTFLASTLLDKFEIQDPRKQTWVSSITTNTALTYYFPYKYKQGVSYDASIVSTGQMTEYSMVLRLAEQYLIRAEARTMLGNVDGAVTDLNTIRTRARGSNTITVLPNYPNTISQTDLVNKIIDERQIELFSEWGHRWLDLKRTGKISSVMNLVAVNKNSTWENYLQLFPIPSNDILANPKITQNPGYQ